MHLHLPKTHWCFCTEFLQHKPSPALLPAGQCPPPVVQPSPEFCLSWMWAKHRGKEQGFTSAVQGTLDSSEAALIARVSASPRAPTSSQHMKEQLTVS